MRTFSKLRKKEELAVDDVSPKKKTQFLFFSRNGWTPPETLYTGRDSDNFGQRDYRDGMNDV